VDGEGRGTLFQSRQNHTRPDPLAGASRLRTVALAPLFKRRPAPNEKLVAETQRRSLAPPGARETLIVREVGSGVHDAMPGTDSEDDRRRTVLRRYTRATMLRAHAHRICSPARRPLGCFLFGGVHSFPRQGAHRERGMRLPYGQRQSSCVDGACLFQPDSTLR
jgi:hypothetical protein